ncbi:hypothetical protein AN643_04310 [Candidatus Epulonipiscioides saccharophilum]|nr:hypothetical protein AN643_04310 [Epulopiscium sp. SCG-B10WGA-EpuloB]
MIKVLLVDDEKLERILLRKGFDWNRHGFEIIGEAGNASEALEFVKDNKPDLILTDINMPKMDGLELSAQLFKKLPLCQIVIVTSYREFDYARRALKLGITDFLLKPINMKDIEALTVIVKERFTQLNTGSDSTLEKNLGVNLEKPPIKKMHKTIVEALNYINQEIYNPELSLKLVASQIYSNESYLSRLFKQEMKTSLIEYITERRISESIRLLNETDLKVYEIAEQIGFRDAHYFGICFKKKTGLTIKKFRSGG